MDIDTYSDSSDSSKSSDSIDSSESSDSSEFSEFSESSESSESCKASASEGRLSSYFTNIFFPEIQILTRIERRNGRTARWRHLNIVLEGKLHTCWEREGGLKVRKKLSSIKKYYFNRPHI